MLSIQLYSFPQNSTAYGLKRDNSPAWELILIFRKNFLGIVQHSRKFRFLFFLDRHDRGRDPGRNSDNKKLPLFDLKFFH